MKRPKLAIAPYRRHELRKGVYRFRKNTLSMVGLIIIVGMVLMAALAPWITPYPSDATSFATNFPIAFQPPSWAHWFGTDDAGRDMFTRVVFGTQVDLIVAAAVQAVVIAIGLPIGLISGYVGGRLRDIILAISRVFITIPPLILALVAVTAFKPDLAVAALVVTLAWWPWYTELVDGIVVSLKQEQFVEASRALGKPSFRIILEDIMPNTLPTMIVKATLDIGFVVILLSTLSFLGVGAQEPTPSWGTMISRSRLYLPGSWWISAFPGLFIFLAVLGFSLLGDGLRDLFDVQL